MFSALATLFEGELNPVHPDAIDHVPLPEGLDLDKWIYEQPSGPAITTVRLHTASISW